VARTTYAGEVSEADTGWYLLVDRPYSTSLRRFLAPDRASPFQRGGVNRYAYCGGDPINRIDPSGQTWLAWLGAALGLTGRRTGAAASVSRDPKGVQDAASTPGTAASTSAAMIDVVSVASAAGSVALTTLNKQDAAGLFGWIGMGASASTDGTAVPAARKGSPTQRFLGQDTGTRRERTIEVVSNEDVPTHRLKVDRLGRRSVTREWREAAHTANPRSRIWTVDSEVNYTDFPDLFLRLKKRGISHATVYSGVDGHPYGKNWDEHTWFHLRPNTFFYDQDVGKTTLAGASAGINVDIVDAGDLLKTDMQDHLLKDGVHIIGSCYGIADEIVMKALNLSNATVYYLSPQPIP
jgi:RHS repeat-associated protein